jgi:hypothetical protein
MTGAPRRRVRPRLRRLAYLLALAAAAPSILAARLHHQSTAALRAGDAALARSDRAAALRLYVEAARAYLPGSASVATAQARLRQIAAAAGDPDSQAMALRAERAALLPAGEAIGPGRTSSSAPASTASPRAPGVAIVLVGFCLWMGALFGFIGRGIDKRLRLRPGWATLCAGGFVFGCAIFLIGLGLG